MTPDELLKPRYKVIADYPFSVFLEGMILELNVLDTRKHLVQEYYIIYKENCYYESLFNKYPYLFKKLFWWEDRKQEDMPDYMKDKSAIPNIILKVIKWTLENEKYWWIRQEGSDTDKLGMYMNYYLPATKEQYESQSSLT